MQLNSEVITTPPRASATVVLLRDAPQKGLVVFLLRRHTDSAVLGGAYVFPGGKLDEADSSEYVLRHLDRDPQDLHLSLAEPEIHTDMAAGLYVAAIREALEECGVLYARARNSDALAHDTVQRAQWQKQLHLYEVPFYYIEYGFAQLGAIAIWRNYKNDPDKTLQQYKGALALGYTRSLPELYEVAGIRFDFSPEYIKELAKFVQEEIEKIK